MAVSSLSSLTDKDAGGRATEGILNGFLQTGQGTVTPDRPRVFLNRAEQRGQVTVFGAALP